MDRDTELALVERLRHGDRTAFDAIFDEFHPRLFRFLARLTRRRDVAEDLLAETWMRLVTHADRLRGDTRLGPWLFTVARHLHISYRRSRALEDTPSAGAVALWPTSPSQASPFEASAASELERRVEAVLATLPTKYREVLLLVVVEGLTPGEAAAVCEVTPEALRQRLSRARALLARRLDTPAALDESVLGEVMP